MREIAADYLRLPAGRQGLPRKYKICENQQVISGNSIFVDYKPL